MKTKKGVTIGPVSARAEEPITLQMVEVEEIEPSRTNPRKAFDQDSLRELAASIAEEGVLEPILLRARSTKGKGKAFEIVAGERRWRAAKLAGLTSIPAIARTLTDEEVTEIQVVENLQRADLHPLEEAAGYERLRDLYGHDVKEIARRVGKSRSYVYDRVKLLELPKAAQSIFLESQLDVSVALMVARIPVPALAEQAARCLSGRPAKGDWGDVEWVPGFEYSGDQHGGRCATVREAAEWIQEHFTLRMDQAAWPLDDAELVPEAGSCAECPKRTANDTTLFPELQRSTDACTDPACFRAKRAAYESRVVAEHEAKGVAVLTGAEAAKAISYSGPYSKVDDYASEAGVHSKSWKRILGKRAMPETAVAIDSRGKPHVVAKTKELVAAAKTKGVAVRSLASNSGNATQKAQRALAKKRNGAIRLLLEAAPVELVGKDDDQFVDLLRLVVTRLAECVGNDRARLVHQVRHPDHQPKKGSFPRWGDLLKKELDGLEDAAVLGLAVQLAAADMVGTWVTGMPEAPKRVATALGLDLKALERKVAPPPRKKATKKRPAKKKATKRSAKKAPRKRTS